MKALARAGLFGLSAFSTLAVQAEILDVNGTVSIFDSTGTVVIEDNITGSYDDVAQLITIDPIIFFGFELSSSIEVLQPGFYDFTPDVAPFDVGTGQLGGLVTTNWSVNTFFSGTVWDVTDHTGGQSFIPVDSDGDGLPGMAFISGPFIGLTMVYQFDVGAQAPAVDVSLVVDGGNTQECSSTGGSDVAMSAAMTFKGGEQLASLDWSVDGQFVGSGDSISTFLSLGDHDVSVTATGVLGSVDTDSTVVSIQDTVSPSIAIAFIDSRTGQVIGSVSGDRVSLVEVQLSGEDVCDAKVDTSGVANPVYSVGNGEIISINGKRNLANLPATAIEVMATATDDSGNSQIGQAVLTVED